MAGERTRCSSGHWVEQRQRAYFIARMHLLWSGALLSCWTKIKEMARRTQAKCPIRSVVSTNKASARHFPEESWLLLTRPTTQADGSERNRSSKTRQLLLDPQGSGKDQLLVLMRHTATSKNGTAVAGHRRRMPVRWVQQKAAALNSRSADFVCYRETPCAAKISRGWSYRMCAFALRLLALCGRL